MVVSEVPCGATGPDLVGGPSYVDLVSSDVPPGLLNKARGKKSNLHSDEGVIPPGSHLPRRTSSAGKVTPPRVNERSSAGSVRSPKGMHPPKITPVVPKTTPSKSVNKVVLKRP